MLCVIFSSAFNTISTLKLIGKREIMGLSTALCNWISAFLMSRPQRVRTYNCTFSLCYCSTLEPPSAVCSAPSCSNCIVIYVSHFKQQWEFILGGNQQSCRVVQENYLLLNISKTKEQRRRQRYTPLYISGSEVEHRFRLFEITIMENLENRVHHTYLPWLKRHRKGFISNENLRRLNSGAIF